MLYYKGDSRGMLDVLGSSNESRKAALRFLVWEGARKIWNKFKKSIISKIGKDIVSSRLLGRDPSGGL